MTQPRGQKLPRLSWKLSVIERFAFWPWWANRGHTTRYFLSSTGPQTFLSLLDAVRAYWSRFSRSTVEENPQKEQNKMSENQKSNSDKTFFFF